MIAPRDELNDCCGWLLNTHLRDITFSGMHICMAHGPLLTFQFPRPMCVYS